MITDKVFDDPHRRRLVEKAFRKVFPDLVVEQMQMGQSVGGGATPAQGGILIDPDVYEEGEMGSNESIVVESDAPRDLLVAALGSAAERMMSVGDDGREYEDGETTVVDGEEIYTPNYVSEVTIDEEGHPGFYIDCKGAIESPMGERFRQILREEFTRLGISSAHVRAAE